MKTFKEWLAEKPIDEGLGRNLLTYGLMGLGAMGGAAKGAEPSRIYSAPTISITNYKNPVDINRPDAFFKKDFGIYSDKAAKAMKDEIVRDRIMKFMDWRKQKGCENIPPVKIDPKIIYQYMDDKEKAELPMEVLQYYVGMVRAKPELRQEVRTGVWDLSPQEIQQMISGILEPQKYAHEDIKRLRRQLPSLEREVQKQQKQVSPEQTQRIRGLLDDLTK